MSCIKKEMASNIVLLLYTVKIFLRTVEHWTKNKESKDLSGEAIRGYIVSTETGRWGNVLDLMSAIMHENGEFQNNFQKS